MARLFRAFIFKLKKDMTFRITLFIGIGLAFFMALLYLFIEKVLFRSEDDVRFITGEAMFLQSLSPVQNFGIAIPVNLISFTVLEFTQGTIRNKIIAGNSKFKIYASLFLSGLVFSLSLITVYALLSLGLGCAFGGGYHAGEGSISGFIISKTSAQYTWRLIIVTLCAYISITSFAILIATLTRQIGGSIPIVIIILLVCYISATIISGIAFQDEESRSKYEALVWALRIINPLYATASNETELVSEGSNVVAYKVIQDETLISSIISNAFYTALFFFVGAIIFKKRDVK